jgi:hypothetical protein
MSDTTDLPLATPAGEILYLPQGSVARARFMNKLAQHPPADDALLTLVLGDVAYNTTWGALKAANLDVVAASEAIALDAADLARDHELAARGARKDAEEAQSHAEGARDVAVASSQASLLSAAVAEAARNDAAVAAAQAQAGATLYPDVATGLAATAEGKSFSVQASGSTFSTTYRKTNGAAVLVGSLPSKVAVDDLGTQVAAVPLRSDAKKVTRAFSVKDLAGYVAGWMGSDSIWRLKGLRMPAASSDGMPFYDAAGALLMRLRSGAVDLPGSSQAQTARRAWSVRDASGFLAAWVDKTGAFRAGTMAAKLATLSRLTVPHPTAGQPALLDVEGAAVRLAGVRYQPIPDVAGKPAFRLKDERGFVAGYIDRQGVGHGVYAGGGGSAAVVHPPMVLEVISSTRMHLHIQGSKGGSRYLSFVIRNLPDPGKNSDVWRVHFVHDSTRSNAGAFSLGKQILIEGEQEFAVKPRGSANFVGGNAHGNEAKFAFYALADGVPVDLSAQASIVCDRFEMVQASHGYRPGATTATTWLPKGDNIMDMWRHWQFTRADGGARWALTNRVTMLADLSFGGYGHLSGPAYFAMACMARALGDGTVVSNTAAWEPDWQPADVSQDGFATQTTTQASAIRLWGPNGWALMMRWLKGWDQPKREVYVSNRAGMNKLYHNFFGGTDAAPVTVTAGDTFEGVVEYLFSNSN